MKAQSTGQCALVGSIVVWAISHFGHNDMEAKATPWIFGHLTSSTPNGTDVLAEQGLLAAFWCVCVYVRISVATASQAEFIFQNGKRKRKTRMGRAEKGKLKGKWHHISKSIFFWSGCIGGTQNL